MPSQSYKFVLRLPAELRDRVAEAAGLYRRSINSEIVARLEQSLMGIPEDGAERRVEPPFFAQIETTFRRDLSDDEDRLIRLYRRLSVQQRRALVDLLS
ncbi:MAG: Arc family DNA-binding protein [Gammaproteobacteria bacterium]|nr:Arc family DNA-binding protein [Gammaproteobacteria bacterium]MXY55473.1 Arc family DNA-binding protein [Gammaproteobacteria bacterium]MYF30013.1 Arc family DNA-binding protein [Gammaproteobacteria bacterium]MYK46327.1 Arc family DNA-binding protein [Gammaproteobacteria bacterium]